MCARADLAKGQGLWQEQTGVFRHRLVFFDADWRFEMQTGIFRRRRARTHLEDGHTLSDGDSQLFHPHLHKSNMGVSIAWH